jgi:tRNA G18 (ribose-2'-O)-methylase SpoU
MRFPAPENSGIGNQCPVCKTDTHVVRNIPLSSEENNSIPVMNHPNLEIVLDNIRSTFNVGAIFRTADGAGISKIYLCGITPPPTHHKVHKTALGAESSVPYEKHNNTLELVKKLKKSGCKIWALEKTNCSTPIDQFNIDPNGPKTVLIVGNEIIGIDPDVLDLCESQIHIPMVGIKNSLNVSIAFGIAVYNLLDGNSY